jgi:hypothetical protein
VIRYEIETSLPGVMLTAPGIAGVTVTRGRAARALVIVHVNTKDKTAFEKAVEGDLHVLGYSADPDGDMYVSA